MQGFLNLGPRVGVGLRPRRTLRTGRNGRNRASPPHRRRAASLSQTPGPPGGDTPPPDQTRNPALGPSGLQQKALERRWGSAGRGRKTARFSRPRRTVNAGSRPRKRVFRAARTLPGATATSATPRQRPVFERGPRKGAGVRYFSRRGVCLRGSPRLAFAMRG